MGFNLWWQSWLDAFGAPFLVAWVFWVVFSICLHELGHGWAAIASGDRTPIYTGHMTWNPLVHIPLPGWIMFFLVGITWGLMPINPNNFRRRYQEALVALAGPAMNLLLALLCMVIGGVVLGRGAVPSGPATLDLIYTFCAVGAMLNMALLVFNLLPVPPLDGSRVVATFIRPYRQFVYSPAGSVAAMVVLVCVFVFGADIFYLPAFKAAAWGIMQVAFLTGGAPGAGP